MDTFTDCSATYKLLPFYTIKIEDKNLLHFIYMSLQFKIFMLK